VIAYNVLTDGRHLPVSIWEMWLADTLTARASDLRLKPRLSRSSLIRCPIGGSGGVSRRTCGWIDTGSLTSPKQSYTIT
jgi:hypothetical protein